MSELTKRRAGLSSMHLQRENQYGVFPFAFATALDYQFKIINSIADWYVSGDDNDASHPFACRDTGSRMSRHSLTVVCNGYASVGRGPSNSGSFASLNP